MTLGLPLIERDGLGDRLKSVAQPPRGIARPASRRAECQARLAAHRAHPRYMKSTLDRFKLTNMLECENSRDKLAQAGYRGQAPLIAFMFFRFVMPFIVFVVMLFYLFVMTHFHWSPHDEGLAPPSPARCSAIICPTSSSPT